MLVDYHVHCIAHGDRKSTRENYLAYLQEAKKKGLQEIGFLEHDEYLDAVDYSVLEVLKKEYTDVKINVGVEMEMPTDQSGFDSLTKYPLDFIMASIHILDGWMFDHPDYKGKYQELDNTTLYKMYFEKLARLLQLTGYNIIGHMDIIKVFGIRSDFDFKPILERGLQALRYKECAVEINTAGTYKPIGEIYPSEAIIKWLYQLDVPITLSSDAHNSKDVGRDIAKTLEFVYKIGYRKLATFDGCKRIMKNILR